MIEPTSECGIAQQDGAATAGVRPGAPGLVLARGTRLCSKGALAGTHSAPLLSGTMLRKLYDGMLALAARPSAPWALGAVSFAESSFFPVPPDVMLVPMVLARPERAWFYALVCTLTSVAGGLLGYAIGALLYDSVGSWLFRFYNLDTGAETFRAAYAQYGHWIILLKGLTPIPYKLVTITSGFAGYDLFWFVVLSFITRGARFFLFATLIGRYGEPIRVALDRHLGVAAAGLLATIVGGMLVFRFVF